MADLSLEFSPHLAETQEAPVELHEVRRAVDRLPQEQRAPLLLHWLHGLKYEEIATKMGLPLGTVQSRISRARKALRAMIEAPGSKLGLAHQPPPPRLHYLQSRLSAT